MELEIFHNPKDGESFFSNYIINTKKFLESLGINKGDIMLKEISENQLSHYSSKTIDFDYNFYFGWGEILGIANRNNYDLKLHSKHSNESFEYFDEKENEKYIPNIIEISFGVERLFLAIISSNLKYEKIENKSDSEEYRTVLKLPYFLAPYKLAVAPLTNKLVKDSLSIYKSLLKENIGPILFIDKGSIGKRYRKQDEIGTPYVITIDFLTKQDNKITIRDRNTMKQDRIYISEIKKYLMKNEE